MKSILPDNKLQRFIVMVGVVYFSWYLLYEFVIHPFKRIDLFVIDTTVVLSEKILNSLNYTTFTGEDRVIGIDGSSGLWIGDKCNGIELFALFAVFIIAYPGIIWRKAVYIPVGIISIEFINIFRVVGLAIAQYNYPKWIEFNHSYVFNVIVYGYIFLLWMLWANKLSSFTKMKEN